MGGKIYIGTSGWVYKSWQKEFYPADVRASDQLLFYASQFPTVEINATFYRLPSLDMVKGWRDKAPGGFVFAVKGSRFLTHMKKLVNLGGGLNRFFRRLQPLSRRIGPVLWQLPPFLSKDPQRLDRFLKRLPKKHRHAVEFRHASWYEGADAFDVLQRHNAAHVSLSSRGMPMNLTVTADFIYIRFHGLEHGAAHDYSSEELEPWKDHLLAQTREGRDSYVYFNNDWNVRAPNNAKMLMGMVGEAAVKPGST